MKRLYLLFFIINLALAGEKLGTRYVFVKFNENKINSIVTEIKNDRKITKIVIKHSSSNMNLSNQLKNSLLNKIDKSRFIITKDKNMKEKFFMNKVVILTYEQV